MPKDFDYWKKQHDSNELKEFNSDDLGTLWLKVKSIVRRGIIDEFIAKESINLSSTGLNDQFKELFTKLSNNVMNSHLILNSYIDEKNANVLESLDIDTLVNELYKVDNFKWGADNQNDLGKYLLNILIVVVVQQFQMSSIIWKLSKTNLLLVLIIDKVQR